MATAISYDAFNLQDTTYLTRDIKYRLLAEKTIDSQADPRRGGFSVVDTYYTQKSIEVSGWILASTDATLRTAIDNLKKALYPQEKNLDISYGGTTIRYKATVKSLDIPEEHYSITQVPFTISFMSLPWGTNTSSTVDTKSITSSPYSSTVDVGGSFGPFPIIRWTVVGTPTTQITVIKFSNSTTEDWIEVAGLTLAANGNYLEIDLENMTVKQDGTTKDFTGVFPSFDPGINSYVVTITGTGYTLSQTITYFQTYL